MEMDKVPGIPPVNGARKAQCYLISMQNGNHAASLTLAAFADDTNLLGNDPTYMKSTKQLVDDTKAAFQTWDHLLHSTGHFMELGKCASYLSIWSFQEDGYTFTIPPHELNVTIEVQDIAGQPQVIPQLPTDKSQKLLGVMKNPIGNQQDEVQSDNCTSCSKRIQSPHAKGHSVWPKCLSGIGI
jgi:hypothetical protein